MKHINTQVVLFISSLRMLFIVWHYNLAEYKIAKDYAESLVWCPNMYIMIKWYVFIHDNQMNCSTVEILD